MTQALTQTPDFRLPLAMQATPHQAGWLLRASQDAPATAATWGPIALPGLRRYLALALHTYFMGSPRWGNDLEALPGECQFLLWEDEGRYGVLVPLLDGDYRTVAHGGEGGLYLTANAGPAGAPAQTVTAAYLQYGADPYTLIDEATTTAVGWMGRGRLRGDKPTPAYLDALGWCTWDAFYEKYAEADVLAGLQAFREAGLVPGWVILDEGWQDYDPATHSLLSFGTKEGFTDRRLRHLTTTAKRDYGVRMIGCWQTLFGEMRGVDAHSPALAPLRRYEIVELNTEKDLFGVVDLPDVPDYFDGYHRQLAEDGVDFVKVDFQCALHLMTYDRVGRASAMRAWQQALQASVGAHFGGQILNCMSNGSDAVYHYTDSTVTRSSDDYYPGKGESHPLHIQMNAYNSLWLGQLCVCDWDMFHSLHPWGRYHAMARAISGGPIYVSDRVGEHDVPLLRRLLAADGEILRCPQLALPTRNLLFSNPLTDRCLLKVFNACGPISLLGLFHPCADGDVIEEMITPAMAEPEPAERYVVYSVTRGLLGVVACDDMLPVRLAPSEADILVISPLREGCAPLGLVEKFNPPAGILGVEALNGSLTCMLRGGGRFGCVATVEVADVLLDDMPVEYLVDGPLVLVDTGDHPQCRVTLRFVKEPTS